MASRRIQKQLDLITQLSWKIRGLQDKIETHGCDAEVISNLIIIQIKDENNYYTEVPPSGNFAVPSDIRFGASLPRLALLEDSE